ncbi:MAG: glycosyltransferase family 4 protein [Pseudomonadota bacterium]
MSGADFPKLAVVLKGYPRLSETFIAQELHALEQRGVDLRIFSLRHPTDPAIHPVHEEIRAPVTYLPEYLSDDWDRVENAWRQVKGRPGYAAAHAAFVQDLHRDPTRNRVRRFGQAWVLAAELPADVTQLYAHFLHTPASVTRYAALIRGLPWCASAHAKDIWTSEEWDRREKLRDVEWLVTCSAVGAAELRRLAPDPAKVHLVYHGLDFTRFPKVEHCSSSADGSSSGEPVRLLSVGRLVEKKGYPDLLEALSSLPRSLNWRLTHIGGGSLAAEIRAIASHLGVQHRITWLGPQPQAAVLAQYRKADIFVLASRIADDGDRDGLPNVLMEAQSQDLACIATAVSAIPELIISEETGLLVPPGAPDALAGALLRLIQDPGERASLGRAGGRRVRRDFAVEAGIDRLMALFCRQDPAHHHLEDSVE